MKRQALVVLMIGGFLSAYAKDWNFTSPDGCVQVTVSDEGGKPSYSVSYNGTAFLERSPLGLITDIGDYSQNVSLGADMKISKVDETYSLPCIVGRRHENQQSRRNLFAPYNQTKHGAL